MSKLGGLKDRWSGKSKTVLSHEPAQPRAEHCSPERLAHLSDLEEPARPGPATVYRPDEGSQPTPVMGPSLTPDVLASPSADPSVVPVPDEAVPEIAVPASTREVPVAPVPQSPSNRVVPEPVVPDVVVPESVSNREVLQPVVQDVVVPEVAVPEVAVPPRSVSQAGRHRRPPSPKRMVPRVFGLTVRTAAVLGFLTMLVVLGLFVVLT